GIEGHPEPGFAARMGAKVRSLKDQLKATAVERDMLRTQLESLRTEADSWRQRADSSSAAKEADLLRQELRELRHRQTFDEVALSEGVRKEALADTWQLSGYRPEVDEVDEGQLRQLIGNQKQARPYLFSGEPDTQQETGQSSPGSPRPGPASGQGTPQ